MTTTPHQDALHADQRKARQTLTIIADNAQVGNMTLLAVHARIVGQPDLVLERHIKGIEVLAALFVPAET